MTTDGVRNVNKYKIKFTLNNNTSTPMIYFKEYDFKSKKTIKNKFVKLIFLDRLSIY